MSTRQPNKRPNPGQSDTPIVIGFGVLGAAGVLAVPAWVGWRVGGGQWGTRAIATSVAIYLPVLAIAVLVTVLVVRARRGRVWTDPLAKSMSTHRDLREMSTAGARQDAQRLNVQGEGIGLPLGKAVLNKQWLYGLYEWSQLWIMGTRAGKSRSVAIPQIMGHDGPVVTTSNKPDVYEATCGPRSERGGCWLNDPQRIAHGQASWYWNPLTFITTVERADKLVSVWAASRTSADMKGADPYFDPEGRKLAADVLVAARLAGEPITRVADWLTSKEPAPGVPDPITILRAGGFETMATDIEGFLGLDDGQRDGLYGTARSFFGFLRDPRFVHWVTSDGADDGRPQFHPADFVRSTDTLYLLSKEGDGSARAITGALTMATYQAGEDYAEECGGRVPVPVLFLLDEAANVCRWPDLPNLYSHAGSRGLLLVTIVQSHKQGVGAWGDGFEIMWSAANIAVAGRGINDADHLRDLATLVGSRQVQQRSSSRGDHGHRSTNTQNGQEEIFSEAALRAFPRGRAVLFASGARVILLELIDYSTYDWAGHVAASIQAYGPGGTERGPVYDPHAIQPLSRVPLGKRDHSDDNREQHAGQRLWASGRTR